jgi:DNA mismatch endonuclease (patch repair protein)
MDIYSKQKRSEIMSKVKASNSEPEKFVRKLLHGLGYRFRLHNTGLPGKPDIVLPKHKTVIFVHGCFWHHHHGCKKSKLPQSNVEFWQKKIMDNVERDKRLLSALTGLGWRVMVVWGCEVMLPDLPNRLEAFLRDRNAISKYIP